MGKLQKVKERTQIATGVLVGIIGTLVVYSSSYTFDQCLRYVVDCPYYRRVWLEALGYAVLFAGAAIIGSVVWPKEQ